MVCRPCPIRIGKEKQALRIWVQKFGGTSLANPKSRQHAVRHIEQALREHVKLVVVVSAMGRRGDPYATDTLIDWIQHAGGIAPPRELDMLLSCGELISAVTLSSLLHRKSIKSHVCTGGDAGIVTNEKFGDARIIALEPQRLFEYLEQNEVVIVTGFQGRSRNGELTTLGRGGSDTTAAALGVALSAEFVDIFTDVPGVLTADPKLVNNARHVRQLTYQEACNLAYNGAKVIHPRAVEFAMQSNISLRIRSTFLEDEGTLVTHRERQKVLDRAVTGIAHVSDLAQIIVNGDEGEYDLQLRVFKAMASHRISVDFINVTPAGVVYTVKEQEIDIALEQLDKIGLQAKVLRGCAKVSVIGGGMNGVPGIMAQIVEALSAVDIPILQTADSNTTIWVLIAQEHLVKAVTSLHNKFHLHQLTD